MRVKSDTSILDGIEDLVDDMLRDIDGTHREWNGGDLEEFLYAVHGLLGARAKYLPKFPSPGKIRPDHLADLLRERET